MQTMQPSPPESTADRIYSAIGIVAALIWNMLKILVTLVMGIIAFFFVLFGLS